MGTQKHRDREIEIDAGGRHRQRNRQRQRHREGEIETGTGRGEREREEKGRERHRNRGRDRQTEPSRGMHPSHPLRPAHDSLPLHRLGSPGPALGWPRPPCLLCQEQGLRSQSGSRVEPCCGPRCTAQGWDWCRVPVGSWAVGGSPLSSSTKHILPDPDGTCVGQGSPETQSQRGL